MFSLVESTNLLQIHFYFFRQAVNGDCNQFSGTTIWDYFSVFTLISCCFLRTNKYVLLNEGKESIVKSK